MATSPKKKSTAPAKSRSVPIVGIVFGIVAVLAIAAVVFSSNSKSTASEYGTPQVQGQLSLMPATAAVDTSATGEAAPTVVGANFDGDTVSIENDGVAKAIVFLAHWCPHCQNEVPAVQAWLDAGGDTGNVALYSVATAIDETRDNYPSSEWLDRENWTVPVIVDDEAGSVHAAYGSGGFPYWVFVNSDGTVAVRAAGELGIDQLQQFISGLS